MSYACRIEKDSFAPNGKRLVSYVITYPRFLLAEMNTHRTLSRNSASSRAIPVVKMIERVKDNPFVPVVAANKKGMQAGDTLADADQENFRDTWLKARDHAVEAAESLGTSAHKQWVNRLLEPFSWTTTIISGTNWANFFALRCHPDAQPEFQVIAKMMKEAYDKSEPALLDYGQWHLPFITPEEREDIRKHGNVELEKYKLVSAGRSARVSYLSHLGVVDIKADIDLALRLISAVPKHSSPFEMVATPAHPGQVVLGNFDSWRQFRHEIPNESIRG